MMVRRLPLGAHLARRLLVNYRVDPAALDALLPNPLRPRLVGGWAVGGIGVIALAGDGGPETSTAPGVRTENATHRIAVEWDCADGRTQAGVYVARRDTDSIINALTGGRIFPGLHHRACFHVAERERALRVHFASLDGEVAAGVTVRRGAFVPSTLFATLDDALALCGLGSPAYSITRDPLRLDGVALVCENAWLEPVEVLDLSSTFFEDPVLFPTGTAYFDSAFLIRDVVVEWRALPSMRVVPRIFSLPEWSAPQATTELALSAAI